MREQEEPVEFAMGKKTQQVAKSIKKLGSDWNEWDVALNYGEGIIACFFDILPLMCCCSHASETF